MDKRKDLKKRILMSLAIAAVLAVLIFTGIYRCPIMEIFHFPCPCCGVSRALLAALHFDWALSFHYHPLWPAILIAIAIHVLYEFSIIKLSKKQINFGLILIAAMIMICYFIRVFFWVKNGVDIYH